MQVNLVADNAGASSLVVQPDYRPSRKPREVTLDGHVELVRVEPGPEWCLADVIDGLDFQYFAPDLHFDVRVPVGGGDGRVLRDCVSPDAPVVHLVLGKEDFHASERKRAVVGHAHVDATRRLER